MINRFSAYFFDMDGVIFNSMPNHSIAWEKVMSKHGLQFTARDTYINEGRTGHDVINECYRRLNGVDAPDGLWQQIYEEKSALFESMGEPKPIDGVSDILTFLHENNKDIWIVTGSGQESLFARLDRYFPNIFSRSKMITALDVVHGKPSPEPYLAAWTKSKFSKEQCCVIENAPLGVRSAKAAGLYCFAVNTGVLTREDLACERADAVLNNMHELFDMLRG